MRLILSERFWFVHVAFGNMVKLEFLAQFPEDHLPHLVMSNLKLFVPSFFATFAYYVINRLSLLPHNQHLRFYCVIL